MILYLISQGENNGYDTYDSAVVAAPDEETARNMDPSRNGAHMDWDSPNASMWAGWCASPSDVTVEYIGHASPRYNKPTVICASFNAG